MTPALLRFLITYSIPSRTLSDTTTQGRQQATQDGYGVHYDDLFVMLCAYTLAATPKKDIIYLRLRINFYTRYGETVKVSGSGIFGDWKQPVALNSRENGDWEVTLIVPSNTPDTEYKYFVEELGGSTQWEGGLNRIARLSEVSEGQMIEIRDTWRVCTSAIIGQMRSLLEFIRLVHPLKQPTLIPLFSGRLYSTEKTLQQSPI
jgi:hypothetical protein